MDDETNLGDAPFDGGTPDSAGDRRSFLKKAGIGAAAAWSAPLLLSTQAAQAQGTLAGITFVNVTSDVVAQGTNTVAVNNPGQSGNLLLAFVSVNPSATVTTPAGWTVVDTQATGNNDVRSFVYQRVADGSLSYSFSRVTSGGQPAGVMRATIVAYAGVASVGPAAGAVEANPLSTHTFPSVTTTGPSNQWIVRLGSLGDSTTSDWSAPPGGQTTRLDTGAGQRAHLVFDSVQASPAATGTVVVSNTPAATRSSQHTVALVP
jgi:hypothetical protein